jgi:hypothetical protein
MVNCGVYRVQREAISFDPVSVGQMTMFIQGTVTTQGQGQGQSSSPGWSSVTLYKRFHSVLSKHAVAYHDWFFQNPGHIEDLISAQTPLRPRRLDDVDNNGGKTTHSVRHCVYSPFDVFPPSMLSPSVPSQVFDSTSEAYPIMVSVSSLSSSGAGAELDSESVPLTQASSNTIVSSSSSHVTGNHLTRSLID